VWGMIRGMEGLPPCPSTQWECGAGDKRKITRWGRRPLAEPATATMDHPLCDNPSRWTRIRIRAQAPRRMLTKNPPIPRRV
jgi:hypothetical protein